VTESLETHAVELLYCYAAAAGFFHLSDTSI